MDRAVIFRYDGARRRVRAAGAYGIDLERLRRRPGDGGDRPGRARLARRGPRDRDHRRDWREGVPDEYATLIAATPRSSARRWPPRAAGCGVILSDRRPDRPPLTRRRAPPAVDARQDRRARRLRAPGDQQAGAGPPAAGAHGPRARGPRVRDPAAVRHPARVLQPGRAQPGRPRAHRRRAPGRAPRPAPRAPAPARPPGARDAHDAAGGGRAAAPRAPRPAPRARRGSDRVEIPRRARAARAVGARRGRPQRPQARRGRRKVEVEPATRSDDTLVLDVVNDGVRGAPRADAAWASSSRRSRRCSSAGSWSSASASPGPGACGWRCRLTGPDLNPSRIAAGSSRAQAARARRRRPRGRALGPAADARRAAVGGALPVARATPRRRSRSPRRYDPHVALVDLFVGQESGAEICEQLLALVAAPERAADLRRRPDLAQRRARRRRVRLHLQGLAGRRHRRRRADGRARA